MLGTFDLMGAIAYLTEQSVRMQIFRGFSGKKEVFGRLGGDAAYLRRAQINYKTPRGIHWTLKFASFLALF